MVNLTHNASLFALNQEPVSSPAEAYQRYGPALLRKAERVLRNSDDATDIVQNLFVDLISRPPKTLDLPYLFSAVTNRCLNHIRNQSNRSRLLECQKDALRGPERRALNVSDTVLTLDLLAKLVDVLDYKSAKIVVYHWIDDLSQDEVATQMGMSRRAVVKRLTKIREKARDLSLTDPADTHHAGGAR
jgi:RNA polymerase sigma-70 factor (ECF subfamily)